MKKTRMLVGLVGANISGSLAPALFAEAFRAAGIDGFYHLLDVNNLPEQRLPKLIEAIKTAGFVGTNITYPFKRDVIALLDALDPEAAQVGAVNTVQIAPDGRTTGYNFDRRGWRNSFVESLGTERAKDKTVVLVGAGGAGRAVAFALRDLDVGDLVIHDHVPESAAALAFDVTTYYGAGGARIAKDLAVEVAGAAGVVNATQVGMTGFPGNPIPVAVMNASQWAADVIYTPTRTEFLKAAVAKGCQTMGGDGMCVHQAAEAFRLFTGFVPDVPQLYKAFGKALAIRDAPNL